MIRIPQLRRCLPLLMLAASLQITAAYYDPGIQRWINRDPIGEAGGVNLGEFAANRVPNGLDAFGWVLVAEGDCAAQMQVARDYLVCDVAREIFAQMDQSPVEWNLKCNSGNDARVEPEKVLIHWDPHSAIWVNSTDGVQSPALGLLHELLHAVIPGLTEDEVIHLENQCARDLGESERAGPGDLRCLFPVAAPNVCGPKTNPIRPVRGPRGFPIPPGIKLPRGK